MSTMRESTKLERMAILLRKTALTMIYEAQSGHPGGSLSASDIIAALYFSELNIDPKQPLWQERDRFILSKGHVCPILYSALMLRGYFADEHANTLRKYGSILQGHPDMKRCPGIDISTGSLGQGLSVGVGMALAAKRDKKDYFVYVMIGDGESQEGQIWEAAQTAYKYALDNLIILVDNNRMQNDGACDDIMPTLDLAQKFESFGVESVRTNGHCMESIVTTLQNARKKKNGKPQCIVFDTIKGKYVSFMENIPEWHGMAPNEEQYHLAMAEIMGGMSK